MRISDLSSDVCSSDLAAKIGQDAADIAFTALGEVAKGFSLDPGATDAKLAQARADLDRSLARSVSATHFNSTELGKGIGEAVAGVVPRLMGDIVGGALRAALSGDSSRSEEHTSELQSLMRISYAVFCLKKKNTTTHPQPL